MYDVTTTRALLQQAGTAITDERHGEALRIYESVLADQPGHELARFGEATCLHSIGEFALAAERFAALAADYPANVSYRYNHGYCLLLDAQYGEAARVLRECDARIDDPQLKSNLAVALAHSPVREIDAARTLIEAASTRLPDDQFVQVNHASLLLIAGELEAGWRRYERRAISFLPSYCAGVPRWNGDTLAGRTLFVWPEQGYGDGIQHARFLEPLAARAAAEGGRVLFQPPDPLFRLFARSFLGLAPAVEILPPTAQPSGFDVHCALLSLPALLGTTRATIPAKVPYLDADPRAADGWRARLASLPGRKVGLAWAGGSHPLGQLVYQRADARRSVRLRELAPLFDVPDVLFVSLQKGEPALQAVQIAERRNFVDDTREIGDFADTAALMTNLDLVITVDTAVCHLAGALAKDVWMMNRWDTDPRWGLDSDESRWYPTLRQYRQTKNGDWSDVIARIAADLRARAT